MNLTSVFYILGWLLSGFGFGAFAPMGVALFYGDASWSVFLASAMGIMTFGILLVLMNQQKHLKISHRDGLLLVVLALVSTCLVSAIPFYAFGVTGSFTDALFESSSALTTTGATVLTGLDGMDRGILFWRAWLQFAGGLGIIVVAVAVLPFLKVGGLQFFRVQGPQLNRDGLQLRIQETTRILWGVYVSITLYCALGYHLAGMGWFDAICHAFTTVATGGFSNYDNSLGHFNSPMIEWVAIIGMLMGATNFVLHFNAMRAGRPGVYWQDPEFRSYMFIMWGGALFCTFILAHADVYSWLDSFRYATFHLISLMTTTGYVTADYNLWPAMVPMLFVMLMLVGGSTGSTAGGLRVLRLMILLRLGRRDLYRLVHPHAISNIRIGTQFLPNDVMLSAASFAGLYLVTFMAVSITVAALGVDMITAYSGAAAMLANIGPGLAEVGPATTFAQLPDSVKWVYTATMMIGRLDVLAFIVVLTPDFWRK